MSDKAEFVWECEHCGKTHDTKKECDEHEKHCKLEEAKKVREV